MKNNSVRLIAVDMDGTLLRSDKTLDPRTAEDIQAAFEKGILTAYCTGRGTAEMQEIFQALPMIRYAICTSGAVIYDCAEEKFIYRNGIGHPFIEKAAEAASRYHAMLHFLTDSGTIVSEADITHMADFHMGIYQPMFLQICKTVSDMAAEGMRHSSIAKINIYFRSAADRSACFSELSPLPLQVTLSENTTLEMTSPGVSKGSGLERLAAFLQIPLEQTAAIGDNYNDFEMLKTAGFPVAMGNAVSEIRQMCGHVTADNDHNGVGEAIRFILDHRDHCAE